MDPEQIKKLRLKHDYLEMCKLSGDAISFIPLRGDIPFVKEYKLIINARTIVGIDKKKKPIFREKSEVIVTLPSDYPQRPPTWLMTTLPIFHSDFYENGAWSYGVYRFGELLTDMVISLVKSFQYEQGGSSLKTMAYNTINKKCTNEQGS